MFTGEVYYAINIKEKSGRDVVNVKDVKQMIVVNVNTALICLNLEAQESGKSVA